jgi:biopolymer transport protein ExbD
MQFEGSRRSSHVPNLTPLIDIVFLLLIFFMLTSHFVREDSLNIQLPETESGQPLQEKKSIEIVINAQDQWLYEGKIVEAEKLKQILHEDLSKLEDKRVRIRGDKTSNLGSAVTVLDLAHKAGATGVDIITEKK